MMCRAQEREKGVKDFILDGWVCEKTSTPLGECDNLTFYNARWVFRHFLKISVSLFLQQNTSYNFMVDYKGKKSAILIY